MAWESIMSLFSRKPSYDDTGDWMNGIDLHKEKSLIPFARRMDEDKKFKETMDMVKSQTPQERIMQGLDDEEDRFRSNTNELKPFMEDENKKKEQEKVFNINRTPY